MRRTRGWTGLRTSVVALGLLAAPASAARADRLLAYDTVGSTIGTQGMTGAPNAIKFVPVAGGSFLEPSSLSLGAFQATALAAGASATYSNTPFHIMFRADAVNGQSDFTPNQTPVDLAGFLNGTLNGPNQSTVTATFAKPQAGGAGTDPAAYSFQTGNYLNTLKVSDNPLTVVPSTTNGGMTTAQAILSNVANPQAPSDTSTTVLTPEPSTALLFAATVAGLGFRHRLRKARASA